MNHKETERIDLCINVVNIFKNNRKQNTNNRKIKNINFMLSSTEGSLFFQMTLVSKPYVRDRFANKDMGQKMFCIFMKVTGFGDKPMAELGVVNDKYFHLQSFMKVHVLSRHFEGSVICLFRSAKLKASLLSLAVSP
jgi:hypothetical protein